MLRSPSPETLPGGTAGVPEPAPVRGRALRHTIWWGDKPCQLSVKAVLLDEEGRCLVLRRSPGSRHNPGKWDFPGGKMVPGESLEHALVREVQEETGLRVSAGQLLGATEADRQGDRVVYLIIKGRARRKPLRLSAEHDGYRWVRLIELPQLDLAQQFLPFARQLARQASAV